MIIMYRFVRFRFLLPCLFILPILFLISIYSNDLQQQSIDGKSASLPFDTKNKNKQLNVSVNVINRTGVLYYREFVEQKNSEQLILNRHLFSSQTTRYILLVQVHTRIVYLKKFIEMLRDVEMVNQTLVIFSHDFIDPMINALINNITFVPVIQIFYPYSPQLYPDEFPGQDSDDCPRDIPRDQALAKGCKNAAYPDKYGHYREVSVVQIKHHWWWKLNFVFNSIAILQNRTDYLLLLLEEDFYLSPDALVFLRNMETVKDRLCPDCLFYTLGNLEKTGKQFSKTGSKISIAYWHARYNLGMTISYTLWTLLVKYAEEFCTIDDYNWDWSLVYLVQQRFKYPRVMWSSATRVIHFGACGTHHQRSCPGESNTAQWTETDKFYRENRPYLFPAENLTLHLRYENKRPFEKLNGGWSDHRDRQLCLSFAFNGAENLPAIDDDM